MPVSIALHPAVARALDALLPAALRGPTGPRARVLAACFVVTAAVGLGFPAYRMATGTPAHLLVPLAAAGVAGLVSWICLWRCTEELASIGRGYFVAMAVLLPAQVAFGDGTGAFAMCAVAAVPICALYVVGARHGLAVAGVVSVVTVGLAVASFAGFRLPPVSEERNTVLLAALATLCSTWLTLLVAWLYEQAAVRTIRALATSEHRSALALRAARGGVVEVRGDGTTWLSPLALELLGLGDADAERPVAAVLAALGPEDGSRLERILTGAAAGAAAAHLATRRPGPSEAWLAWDAAFERDDDGTSRVVLIVRDVTEERRVLTMKDDFVANVSHELRTPITTVQGAIGLLRAGAVGPMPAAVDPLLMLASRSTRRLAALVDDLLDLQRLESGELTLAPSAFELSEVAREVIEAARLGAASNGVSVELTAPADGRRLRSDRRRVAQVLTNLVDNACKFSPSDTVVVVRLVTGEGGAARLEVHDDGPGIPEWFRPRVFERFAQAGGGPARPHGGAGLGLNVAYHLCARLGGQIGFTARSPRGTTFWFELPDLPEA